MKKYKLHGVDGEDEEATKQAVVTPTIEPPLDPSEEPRMFYSGSVGQAAALSTKYELSELRLNPNPNKSGQIQFGFVATAAIYDDANAYFSNKLMVDAMTYWDKIYELRKRKYNLMNPELTNNN